MEGLRPSLCLDTRKLRESHRNTDVGVQVKLATRPMGTSDPRSEDSAGADPTVPGTLYAQPQMTPPGASRIDELIADLKSTSGPIESRLSRKWRNAVEQSMNAKVTEYTRLIQDLYAEIKDQHHKVNSFVRLSKVSQDRLSDDSAQPVPPPRDDDDAARRTRYNVNPDSPLAPPDKDTWELAKEAEGPFDRWRSLISTKASLHELVSKANERITPILNAADEPGERQKLIKALVKLRGYDTQAKLLDVLVDIVRAFISNPLVAQNAFINLVLMGNPGTGKTRLSRDIAQLLGSLGMFIYEGDDYVEATRSDFIAQYEGQTAIKARTFLLSNLEKVIFIDEAYSLTKYDARGELEAYGAEASTEIVKFLSDNVGKLALIVAGYEDQMKEEFLASNDGLNRRFPYQLVLEDYDGKQMARIFLSALYEALKTPTSALTQYDIQTWFSVPAMVMLSDICDGARKETVLAIQIDDPRYKTKEIPLMQKYEVKRVRPQLHKIFTAQAGAMVNLANVAAILLMADKNYNVLGLKPPERGRADTRYVDFQAMYNIILTLLQRSLAGKIVVVKDEEPSAQVVAGTGPVPSAGIAPPPPPPGMLPPADSDVVAPREPQSGGPFSALGIESAATGVRVARNVEEWKEAKDQLDEVLIYYGWLIKTPGPGNTSITHWKVGDNVRSYLDAEYPPMVEGGSDSNVPLAGGGGSDGSESGMDVDSGTAPAVAPRGPRAPRSAQPAPGTMRS